MVAKETLNELPNVQELVKLSQSLAMLDAIMSPEWEFRYFSFNRKWGENEMLASMRNGGGDDYFIFFNEFGAIIKGFDHESEMNLYDGEDEKVWAGIIDEVPSEFQSFLQEPAFELEFVTFCIWRLNEDTEWKTGKIEYPNGDETADGSNWLLFLLDGKPKTYFYWAKDYYEKDIDLETVEKIYRLEPLTEEVVRRLNPYCNFADLSEDIEEIGYPIV